MAAYFLKRTARESGASAAGPRRKTGEKIPRFPEKMEKKREFWLLLCDGAAKLGYQKKENKNNIPDRSTLAKICEKSATQKQRYTIQEQIEERYSFCRVLNEKIGNITKNLQNYACNLNGRGYNRCQKRGSLPNRDENAGFSLTKAIFLFCGISEAAAAYILRRAGGACPRPGKTGTRRRRLPGALHEKRMVHP